MNTKNQLSHFVTYGDYDSIKTLYAELTHQKANLDKYFTLFLDKFSNKMKPETLDTPLWKMYREKVKQYHEIDTSMKIAEYYLKRNHV
jgi:hypothetical protein